MLKNVPGLLNSHNGKDFRVLLEALDELRYSMMWRTLDAKYFGTPQRRRRVFITGSFGSAQSARVLLSPKEVISLLNRAWARDHLISPPLEKAMILQLHIKSSTQALTESLPQDLKQKVIEAIATEYEALQGFPSNWTLID